MVSNSDLAKQFERFAQILELKGDLRFKIIAYQRAAQTIESYGEPFEALYEREGLKGLRKVSAIGEAISSKIVEYIKTGKIVELEKLKKGSPKSEVDFMEIPGVGPKTAMKLFDELGARDISELKAKLKEVGPKYFKPKTLANIQRGLEIKQSFGDRVILSFARPFVEEIVQYLKKSLLVDNVEAVGSYRRWQETIGDIDIIASSHDSSKVIDHFVEFPDFYKIINQGKTKSTAIHKSGMQVDLEILPKEEFGSLLQHFTGSKEHNVALRTYAQTKGLSISEHGVKIVKTGKTIKCKTEKEVYGTVGMDFIEPELRENRGEIKAALEHKLPNIVELSDIRGDLHTHSLWSDGQFSIEQMAKAASDRGYEYLAISDHTISLGAARGLSEDRFIQRLVEIKKVSAKFPNLKLLNSCEVNIKPDGLTDLSDKFLESFDLVTASVHSSLNQTKDEMTQRLIKAAENPNIDIIGHPSGRLINERESCQVDWKKLFDICVQNKTILEINAFPQRLDLSDALVFQARQMGVKFAISTDAHVIYHLDNMVYGVSVARRGWCEKKDIINTLSLEKLKKILR